MKAGLGEAGVWVEIHPFFLGSGHGLVLRKLPDLCRLGWLQPVPLASSAYLDPSICDL